MDPSWLSMDPSSQHLPRSAFDCSPHHHLRLFRGSVTLRWLTRWQIKRGEDAATANEAAHDKYQQADADGSVKRAGQRDVHEKESSKLEVRLLERRREMEEDEERQRRALASATRRQGKSTS